MLHAIKNYVQGSASSKEFMALLAEHKWTKQIKGSRGEEEVENDITVEQIHFVFISV